MWISSRETPRRTNRSKNRRCSRRKKRPCRYHREESKQLDMPDLLLEIGCEEIPARMIDAAQSELAFRVGELLEREALGIPAGVSAPVTTPRRLSVMASIADHQMDITGQVTGPAVTIAFKDGQPTPAAHAFARKAGVDVSQLEKVATP